MLETPSHAISHQIHAYMALALTTPHRAIGALRRFAFASRDPKEQSPWGSLTIRPPVILSLNWFDLAFVHRVGSTFHHPERHEDDELRGLG